MGRKLNSERVKKGPGKKAKKQEAPLVALKNAKLDKVPKASPGEKKLSSHQKKRLKKRLAKQEEKSAAAKAKKAPKQQKVCSFHSVDCCHFSKSKLLRTYRTVQNLARVNANWLRG